MANFDFGPTTRRRTATVAIEEQDRWLNLAVRSIEFTQHLLQTHHSVVVRGHVASFTQRTTPPSRAFTRTGGPIMTIQTGPMALQQFWVTQMTGEIVNGQMDGEIVVRGERLTGMATASDEDIRRGIRAILESRMGWDRGRTRMSARDLWRS